MKKNKTFLEQIEQFRRNLKEENQKLQNLFFTGKNKERSFQFQKFLNESAINEISHCYLTSQQIFKNELICADCFNALVSRLGLKDSNENICALSDFYFSETRFQDSISFLSALSESVTRINAHRRL